MVRQSVKHAVYAIMVSSSVVSLAMEVGGENSLVNGGSSHGTLQGNEAYFEARMLSLTSVSQGLGKTPPLILRTRGASRRNSAPDGSGGTSALRRTLAVLFLNPGSSSSALPSPTANSLYTYGATTPRSLDGTSPATATPKTPVTPPGHIFSFNDELVLECRMKDQPLDDGCVIERVRFFPREQFSRADNSVILDYGTIFLRVNPAASKCSVDKIEINEENGVVRANATSVMKDLELRALMLAAERQKELQQ